MEKYLSAHEVSSFKRKMQIVNSIVSEYVEVIDLDNHIVTAGFA